MIIVRSPLRVSFFGGGTDHPTLVQAGSEPGAVLSTTINKYIYVQLRRLPAVFDFNYRIAWGLLEEVKTLNEIQHPVVREVLRHYARPTRPATRSSTTPTCRRRRASARAQPSPSPCCTPIFGNLRGSAPSALLAREAIFVEQQLLKETVGCQDQIAAAYGGLNRIDFYSRRRLSRQPVVRARRSPAGARTLA